MLKDLSLTPSSAQTHLHPTIGTLDRAATGDPGTVLTRHAPTPWLPPVLLLLLLLLLGPCYCAAILLQARENELTTLRSAATQTSPQASHLATVPYAAWHQLLLWVYEAFSRCLLCAAIAWRRALVANASPTAAPSAAMRRPRRQGPQLRLSMRKIAAISKPAFSILPPASVDTMITGSTLA